MKTFNGRVAAITGASSGIGRALALELARQNCDLALCSARAGKALEETATLAARLGVDVTHHQVDVSRHDEVGRWATGIVAKYGRVNVIVNNAGVGYTGTVMGTSDADLARVMDINFWGVVHGTRCFLPHLIASGEGHVVNVSSMAGVIAMPGMSAYHASKFAVRGYTESLRQELDADRNGVSATCVIPGGVKTNIVANAHFSTNTVGVHGDVDKFRKNFERLQRTTPEQAAEAILKGIRRNDRRVLIGADVKLADGMQRAMPQAYQRLISAGVRLMGR